MKYLVKINFIFLFCLSFNLIAQIKDQVKNNSALSCIQGVWQPINSTNEELVEYVIYESFKSISISYANSKKLEGIMLTANGFYNFDDGYNLGDSLKFSELESDGNYFVWFFLEDIKPNGWVQIGGAQEDFICDGDIIEMTDNAMTILEKQPYLPFTAYHHLKRKEEEDGRAYINEFNISNKLKKAKIVANKTYFHDQANESTRRKAFVIKGDELIVDKVANEWIKAAYEGKNTTTIGWLKASDLEILDQKHSR